MQARRVDGVEAGGVTGGVALSKEEKRLLAPAGCRAYMRKTLVKEFPEIVQGFVDAAKTGSCPHVKMVTELMKPVRKANPRPKKGPAAKLIENLEKQGFDIRE
jgi:hypothetical protein